MEKSILNKTLADLKKKYIQAIIPVDNDHADKKLKLSSPNLNFILGGGLSLNKIYTLFGAECISEDTEILFNILDTKSNKKINGKGGTIRRLYERFHNVDNSTQIKENIKFTVPSINEEDKVFHQEIIDVVYSGKKEVYRVEDIHGNFIECTKDHKFYTEQGYKTLSELNVGDELFIHDNIHYKKNIVSSKRPSVMVKYHPKWPVKKVDKYSYHRGIVSRAYYEAYLNNMSYADYILYLNTESKAKINELKFIPDWAIWLSIPYFVILLVLGLPILRKKFIKKL